MTIHWQMMTDGYNLTHGRKFTTFDMLDYLYLHMGSMRKVANYLGVSAQAATHKMDMLHVPRVRKPFISWKLRKGGDAK